MSLDALISHYGLIAIFVGCFFEGETAAIAGGVMAHRHLLVLWQVAAVVILAAFLADLTAFEVGRRFSGSRFVRKVLAKPAVAKVMLQVAEHPRKFASVFRFIPGLRILGPVALAQSSLPFAVFAAHALVSAVIWGWFYAVVGHAVAAVLVRIFGEDRQLILLIAGVLLVLGTAGYWLWRRFGRQGG
ncbi:MAG: VTT domain-containing protein [Cypionkella sp.]|jgi:membrane protein DedA with SNARE-associated domain